MRHGGVVVGWWSMVRVQLYSQPEVIHRLDRREVQFQVDAPLFHSPEAPSSCPRSCPRSSSC